MAAFEAVLKNSYAVVFITDEIFRFFENARPDFFKKALIMVIPGCLTRNKMGLKELTAIVEKAVGISNIMDKA
jgi:vacuolar-type H+-ATPase subunit F/Vma7